MYFTVYYVNNFKKFLPNIFLMCNKIPFIFEYYHTAMALCSTGVIVPVISIALQKTSAKNVASYDLFKKLYISLANGDTVKTS